jgi:hypothetical protein
VLGANGTFASSSKSNSASGALQDNVEVHSEDTSEGVILDTQIDMLLNAESKTSYIEQKCTCIREVLFLKFSVFHLQASLQNFIGLIASNSHVYCDFFVSLNAEASDCVSGSGGDWLLA